MVTTFLKYNNLGVDLKWGGYKVIDGGKGGVGPNRKPRGELPPALQKKDPLRTKQQF